MSIFSARILKFLWASVSVLCESWNLQSLNLYERSASALRRTRLLQTCILCQPVFQVRKVYCTPRLKKQELCAYAHEMRDSISLISDEGLYPVISAKIHFKCASQPKIAKKSLKTPILGVEGHQCWYHRKGRQQCLL